MLCSWQPIKKVVLICMGNSIEVQENSSSNGINISGSGSIGVRELWL
jgi:hypothetical protein